MFDGIGETIKICLAAWFVCICPLVSLFFVASWGVIGFFPCFSYAAALAYVLWQREKQSPGADVFDDRSFPDNLTSLRYIEDLRKRKEIEDILREEERKKALAWHDQRD